MQGYSMRIEMTQSLYYNWDLRAHCWEFERIEDFALNFAGRFIFFLIGKFLMKQSECIDDLILLHFAIFYFRGKLFI